MIRRAVAVLVVALPIACGHPGPVSPTTPTPIAPPAAVKAIRLTPSTGELPIGGGSLEIKIETVGNLYGTIVAPDVPVELSASDGALTATTAKTDQTGHAKVSWTGTKSAEITARAGEVSGAMTIHVATVQSPIPPGPAPAPPPTPTPTPIPPTPPGQPSVSVALTATPSTVLVNEMVTFSAASTVNAEAGSIRYYAWDLDGDGVYEIAQGGATQTRSYPTSGTRTVSVIATSTSWTTGAATTTVTVNDPPPPVPPALSVTLTSNVSTVTEAGTVNFTATPSNLNGETVAFYSWDLDGNGTADGTTVTNTRPFTYPTHGSYTARVTITTSGGRTASGTRQILVTSP